MNDERIDNAIRRLAIAIRLDAFDAIEDILLELPQPERKLVAVAAKLLAEKRD